MNDAQALAPPRTDEEPAAAVARIESLSQKLFSPGGSGRMLWHVWGRGKPLVLLHGGFGSWMHWIRNIPVMASRFSVFAATLPGFGDSDDLPEPQTPENLAAIVSAGIDRVLPPGERFHMIGFSFGGIIGGLVAGLQGGRLLSHTFSGSGGMGLTRNPMEPLVNWRRTKTQEERLRAHRRNLEILMVADSQKIDDLAVYIQNWNTPRCRVRTYKYWHLDILRESLYKVKGRLMGLYGSRDAIVSGHMHERVNYLSAIQPDLVFREIEGAGHWACYEAADAFNKTYFEMLQTIGD
ncbi:MAG: alpha/beta hydrolase [Thermodesulfobacteriota bacterium]